MAQPTSNPKIEELRFRIKTDPKSRLFYPLAEELRKINQWDESERVLHAGLEHHPTYLSAWVSLGRVLRDQHKDAAAIEALKKALQLDPGNVVAARLLGDSYLTTGDKVEAIKKYKLVLALMPGDQEIESIIEGLDHDLNPIVLATVGEDEPGPGSDNAEASSSAMPAVSHAEPSASPMTSEQSPFDEPGSLGGAEETIPSVNSAESAPFAGADHPMDETRPQLRSQHSEESPWGETPAEHLPTMEKPFDSDGPMPRQSSSSTPVASESSLSTGDEEPMHAAHGESPFEEPSGYTSAALTVEHPRGMHVEEAPSVGSESSMWSDPIPSLPPEAPSDASPWAEEPAAAGSSSPVWGDNPNAVPDAANVFAAAGDKSIADDDVTNTLTMADLYVGQGQPEQARAIYERILERDPANESVRAKLAAMAPAAPGAGAQVADHRSDKLGRWLSKVGRREGGSV